MRAPLLLLIGLLVSCGSPSNGTPTDLRILEQVNKANAIAQRQGYAPIAAPTVVIMQRDPRCSDPTSFTVEQEVPPGTNYDNDPNYDYDDRLGYIRICVGGRFIAPSTIQVTREAIDAGYGVWYEMEHMILYHRDRDRYYQTMYHTPTTGHPILGE